ncbi:hypothetical protein [Streptomyces sp. NPDC005533]|uniref:hypothetical protein n=1 Tax=Streptomyces sp. NPDC005533 TaxID=3364723 RepID=UPI0036990223
MRHASRRPAASGRSHAWGRNSRQDSGHEAVSEAAGIWASGRRVSALWALTTLGPAALTNRLRAVAAAQSALEPAA